MILHEKSPSTISEIAERALMNLSTMTRVAQRLARDGLVKLASNQQDARSTDVHITPEGDAAVEKIAPPSGDPEAPARALIFDSPPLQRS